MISLSVVWTYVQYEENASAARHAPANMWQLLRERGRGVRGKFISNSTKKLWDYSCLLLNCAQLLPHSLVWWLDFTAGFLYPMNHSAMHHRVRKGSSATAITKISEPG